MPEFDQPTGWVIEDEAWRFDTVTSQNYHEIHHVRKLPHAPSISIGNVDVTDYVTKLEMVQSNIEWTFSRRTGHQRLEVVDGQIVIASTGEEWTPRDHELD
jgi:hypothetical protein